MDMAEEIDNDFGHTDHPDAGEPVNPNTYLYRAPNGPQRVTKARGGDNALIDKEHIKEDATKLFSKLKKDYRAYTTRIARQHAVVLHSYPGTEFARLATVADFGEGSYSRNAIHCNTNSSG